MCRMCAALRDRGLTISGEGCRWWRRRLIDATPAPLAASFSTAGSGGRPLPPIFPLLLRFLCIYDSSTFPPYLTAILPASPFLLLSSTLSSFLAQYTEYALTDSTAPLVPSLRYHLPFLRSCPPPYPPTLSSPPGSSQRCTTHVLTERRTSDLRGSRCDPLRVRHPPDGGRLGVAPRAVLSPSQLSRRLSSRLETIRYAGDPGPSTLNPGSRWHVGSPRGERETRASETR